MQNGNALVVWARLYLVTYVPSIELIISYYEVTRTVVTRGVMEGARVFRWSLSEVMVHTIISDYCLNGNVIFYVSDLTDVIFV